MSQTEPNFDRVAILGVGQIGASFALALKQHGLCGSLAGFSRTPETRAEAVARGILDEAADSPEACVRNADLIYLAPPVRSIVPLVQRIAPVTKPGAVITDAGSTKVEIVQGVRELDLGSACFVGGHPMAGTEGSGLEFASADLFEGRAYVLTPDGDTPAVAVERLRALVERIGSRCYVLSPQVHDRAVAAISHLPHLLAAALVHLAGRRRESGEPVFELAAGSFRDATRVAGSYPRMWLDILASNRAEILTALTDFEGELVRLRELVEGERWAELERAWERAGEWRRNAEDRGKGRGRKGGRRGQGNMRTTPDTPPRRPCIAIDGPVASGKSSVARQVAEALGFTYVDTGAMYRAIGWKAWQAGLPLDDEAQVVPLAEATDLAFIEGEDGRPHLLVDGTDRTDEIRTPAVGQAASKVSTLGGVRDCLVAKQRAMAAAGGVVMEGRDIQTVVLPTAELKVFLEASVAERARRRYEELRAQGQAVELADIERDLQERDDRDRNRALAPLKPATDAVILDTDPLSQEEVVARIVALARARGLA